MTREPCNSPSSVCGKSSQHCWLFPERKWNVDSVIPEHGPTRHLPSDIMAEAVPTALQEGGQLHEV